jgi:signal transduction histidine kinase
MSEPKDSLLGSVKELDQMFPTAICRLIAAHDEERRRIAGELRDDTDRAALLAASLSALEQSSELNYGARARIQEIFEGLKDLGSSIQKLSDRLCSSKLEFLGLESAARIFCRDFSKQHKVEVGFTSLDVPGDLPQQLSRALFTVLEEALHNAAKHSGARHVEVLLKGSSGEAELTVRDSGTGFDLDKAMNGSGLGLVGMRERLNWAQGTFSIVTKPLGGTEVLATVFPTKRYFSAQSPESARAS